MKNLKFRKGMFITQTTSRDESFAVFEGEAYESSEGKGGPVEYSLLCFYSPNHFTKDSNGNFKREYVFECCVDDETCEYFINDDDLQYWRECTEAEKTKHLKYLAEIKRIAFDEETKSFRKLAQNEVIRFGSPQSTGACGGNVRHLGGSGVNPYYRGTTQVKPETDTKKYISRNVDENWEQKEPIETMSIEHKCLVNGLCIKLANAFNYSSVGAGVMRYPTNGSQVPVRQYGSEDMCGWPAGMMGDIYGGYCAWPDYYE